MSNARDDWEDDEDGEAEGGANEEEIEKFHQLFGDEEFDESEGRFKKKEGGGGGDDGGKGKRRKKGGGDFDEPETGNVGRFLGISYFPTPIPDAKDRPSTDPLQWKAFEDKYHVKPYASPREEYIHNEYELNMDTLIYRWRGYNLDGEIALMFVGPDASKLQMERIKAQQIKRRQLALPDPNDEQDIQINNAWILQIILKRIQDNSRRLFTDAEVKVEELFRMFQGGTVVQEMVRPMSQASRSALERDLRKDIEMYLTLTGQASKIITTKHEGTLTIGMQIDAAMKRNNHRTADGYTIEELEARAAEMSQNALPPGRVIDAEIIPKQQEYEEQGWDTE